MKVSDWDWRIKKSRPNLFNDLMDFDGIGSVWLFISEQAKKSDLENHVSNTSLVLPRTSLLGLPHHPTVTRKMVMVQHFCSSIITPIITSVLAVPTQKQTDSCSRQWSKQQPRLRGGKRSVFEHEPACCNSLFERENIPNLEGVSSWKDFLIGWGMTCPLQWNDRDDVACAMTKQWGTDSLFVIARMWVKTSISSQVCCRWGTAS